MLCSNCQKVIKPVVAVDIDGTLGDYHGHFLAFAECYLGRSWVTMPDQREEAYDGREGYLRWFCRAMDTDARTFRDIKLAYRQGAQKRSMPIFRDAKGLTKGVRAEGAELWLTTTRPYLRLDNVDPDTRAWLERHDIEFDALVYDENKYTVLADRVDRSRVVAVLDDLPEQYDAATILFGDHVPILNQTMYNRGVSRPNSASSLYGAWQRVAERIENYKRRQR